jgi:hypothetical protein
MNLTLMDSASIRIKNAAANLPQNRETKAAASSCILYATHSPDTAEDSKRSF